VIFCLLPKNNQKTSCLLLPHGQNSLWITSDFLELDTKFLLRKLSINFEIISSKRRRQYHDLILAVCQRLESPKVLEKAHVAITFLQHFLFVNHNESAVNEAVLLFLFFKQFSTTTSIYILTKIVL
jgi:hypothetical protein